MMLGNEHMRRSHYNLSANENLNSITPTGMSRNLSDISNMRISNPLSMIHPNSTDSRLLGRDEFAAKPLKGGLAFRSTWYNMSKSPMMPPPPF